MDIQKEREAFEAIPRNARVLRGAKFKDGEYVALSLFDESSKELAAQLNYGWSIWQAAKAQAVPDGFVVVPKKATKKMLDAGYEAHDGFFSNGAVQDVYVAMIEAQDE